MLSYIVIFSYHVYTVTYIIIEMNKDLKVVFRMVTSKVKIFCFGGPCSWISKMDFGEGLAPKNALTAY